MSQDSMPAELRSSRCRCGWSVYALTLYWLALVLATHLPGHWLGGSRGPLASVDGWKIPHVDKVAHATAYFGLTLLVLVALRPGARWQLAGLLVVLGLHGVVDELLQALVPTRTPDVYDWLADMTGVMAGLISHTAQRRLRCSKS